MRIAVVSDIHGNLPALKAVAQDIDRRGVDHVVNLGDSLSGPLMPAETAHWLMATGWTHLAGNHELQILDPGSPFHSRADAMARSSLTEAELQWISGQKTSGWLGSEVYLCHGTPLKAAGYLLEKVEPSGSVRLATAVEILARLGEEPLSAQVVLCGHTHVPRSVRLPSGLLIINPGSVGLPGFDDLHPVPHVMETGSPDARYAVVEKNPGGAWSCALLSVPYDVREMVHLARRAQMQDWVRPLQTGYAYRGGGPASILDTEDEDAWDWP